MPKTLCHEDTQTRDRMSFSFLPFQTPKPSNVSVASSSLRSRSWNEKERENFLQHMNLSRSSRKHSRMVARRLEEQGAHATREEEESACHLITLCLHWKPRMIPLGTTQLKGPGFYRPRGAPHFVVLSDGISGTSKVCCTIVVIYMLSNFVYLCILASGEVNKNLP